MFLGSFLAFCLLAAGVNYAVDPYALFGTPRIEGFNRLKPMAADRVRVVKPYQVLRQQPRTLIGGNSRPEMGLDPASGCWSEPERPVYNLAAPGVDLYLSLRFLQHAMEAGEVQRVFLGLDLLDFLRYPGKAVDYSTWQRQPSEYESRLTYAADGTPNTALVLTRLSDMLTGLFSLNGLADSMYTVASQAKGNLSTRREDGFNPARDYLDIISTEGQLVLFKKKNREILQVVSDPKLGIYRTGGEWSTIFETLRRFLRQAKRMGVDVVLFINPYHGEYLASIALVGKWPLLEAWKHRLLRLAREEGGVPLWDFNTLDRYSTEPPPTDGDLAGSLQWFWEPAHYKRELGELMLASMLERECVSAAHAGFGQRLDERNLQDHLGKLALGLERYRKTQKQAWLRLQQAVPQGVSRKP